MDAECVWCGKKNIQFGGMIDGYSDNPKIICEDCAIDNWQKDYGFKTRKAAAAHRRRMFDVGYLFQEMVADKYMLDNGIDDLNNLDERVADNLTAKAQCVFNEKISKRKKQDLEIMIYQKDIENYLAKIIKKYL